MTRLDRARAHRAHRRRRALLMALLGYAIAVVVSFAAGETVVGLCSAIAGLAILIVAARDTHHRHQAAKSRENR